MKKITLFALFTFLIFTLLAEDSIFKLNSDTETSTELEFVFDNFDISEEIVDGQTYQKFEHKEAGYITNQGYPEIPNFSQLVAIPNTGTATIKIVTSDEILIENINLYPSQGTTFTEHEGKADFFKNEDVYSTNKFISYETIQISDPAIMRDLRVVSFTINPLQYNPVTKEAKMITHAIITINYDNQPGLNEKTTSHKISRSFEALYKNSIINYNQRDIVYEYQLPTLVILYPSGNNDVESIVHHLYEWKREKGFNVVLASSDVTGTSSSSIHNYLQDAYDTWENPPVFIMPIGDPQAGSVVTAASGTNGDHHYTELEGADYLPDAFVGRLSAENPTQLMTMWNKIKFYEKLPNLTDLEWYRKNLLVGDSAHSGTSTYYTNLYIRDVMLDFDPEHTFIEMYNGAPSVPGMNEVLSDGVLFFNYRGYIGMSGWDIPDIATISNGTKLINAVIITCATGSFVSGTSRTEAFVRHGTPNNLKGAISCIGMATAGTNTRYNNALDGGIFHGLFKNNQNTMGQAVATGKIHLFETYSNSNSTSVNNFITWLNQIGDPSMSVWKTQPKPLIATYQTSVNVGANYLDVHVTNIGGQPIENAWVTARQVNDDGIEEILFSSNYTDENGDIRLLFDANSSGNVKLTATAPQYIPHLGNFEILADEQITVNSVIIDDDNEGNSIGNNNGDINPEETIEFTVELLNNLDNNQSNVEATLSYNGQYISFDNDQVMIDGINVDDTAEATFVFTIAPDCPDNYRTNLTLTLVTDANSFTNSIPISVNGADVDLINIAITDGSEEQILDPGEITNVQVTAINNGDVDLHNVQMELISNYNLLIIEDSEAYIGDILVGETIQTNQSELTIHAHAQLIPGMILNVGVRFYNDTGYEEYEEFDIMVGLPDINDPIGPDEYGYFIFDDEDTEYIDCPSYDWIEIDPNFGGDGINTDMSDTAEDDDKSISINLPFTFNFYGEPYTEARICTNGWISFANTEQATFRNWLLPGPLGPNRMIAAFWDDLATTGGGVYTKYIQEMNAFVIEWSHMQSRQTGAENTFQMILYNPQTNGTAQGDGKIKLQYKVVHNDDNTGGSPAWTGGNYCSVGIEDKTSLLGLQYTFDNMYHPNAKVLEDEMALMISGLPQIYEQPHLMLGNVSIHDQNNSGHIDAGEIVDIGIFLNNIGEAAATEISSTLTITNQYATVLQPNSNYININGGESQSNTNYFSVQVNGDCPNNYNIPVVLDVVTSLETWQYFFALNVYRPELEMSTYMLNDADGNNNGVPDPGETIKLGLSILNNSYSTAIDVIGEVSTTDPLLTITNSHNNYGNLNPGQSIQKIFEIEISEDAEAQSALPYLFSITSGNTVPIDVNLAFGVTVSPSILDESFEDFLPEGWTIDEHQQNWQNYDSNNAGGTAPEISIHYSPSFNGVSHLISPPMDLMGANNVSVSFKHSVNDFSNANSYTLGLGLLSNGEWETLWSIDGGVDYPADSVLVEVDSQLLNQSSVQFGWFLDGNSYDINNWYIDDVYLNATLGNSAVISGNIMVNDGNISPLQSIVTANIFSTQPDSLGDYELLVSPGEYSQISASMEYCSTDTVNNISLVFGEFLENIDFDLEYLNHPTELNYVLDETFIDLSWNISDEATPDEYNIYRQKDSGDFIYITSTNETNYSETVLELHNYRYFVTAIYDNDESAQSNEIEFFVEAVSNEDNDVVPLVTEMTGNYPNPFNPTTNIAFSVSETQNIKITVFNIKGQLVKELINEPVESGYHNILWNGKDTNNKQVSTGVYFMKFDSKEIHQIRKSLLLK